jgi:cell division protein FtsA
LVADQYRTYIPAGDQIIDVIPQEFTVDNFQNIPNPIGYSGVRLVQISISLPAIKIHPKY